MPGIHQQPPQTLSRSIWKLWFNGRGNYPCSFILEKCNSLRVSRSRCPSTYNCTPHGTTLREINGRSNISWHYSTKRSFVGKHVHNITSKVNRKLGFMRRNVRGRSKKTREKLYNTLVRPHLEYAASVWDPHVTKQKQAVETVQRRAAI